MSVITRVPEPNLWELICKEFQSRRPPYDEDKESVSTEYEDYDPAKHNPVFYGRMHSRVEADFDVSRELDSATSHPSCIGYSFINKPKTTSVHTPPPPPPKDTCPPKEYLEYYVFPYLLPGLEQMLLMAREEKCFERKRTRFNALDFITKYLYRKNPRHMGREHTELMEIPFVKDWLKEHPRPPLPLSLVWTEEQASVVIQSHWRGYLVRRDPEVQELRQWQREWREINSNIQNRVNDFWESKMPDSDMPLPSEEGSSQINAPADKESSTADKVASTCDKAAPHSSANELTN